MSDDAQQFGFNGDAVDYALSIRRGRRSPRRRPQQRYCHIHGTRLTTEEERDAQIVGSLPRCRECLEKVGMPSCR